MQQDLADQVAGLLWPGCIFVTALLSMIWTGLLLGIPVSPYHVPLAIGALVGAAVAVARRGGMPIGAGMVRTAFLLALLAVCVFLQMRLFDTSYAGLAYHQVGTIALARGWNPHRTPHVAEWFHAAFPDLAWVGASLWIGGLWTDHYPKASWALGAAMTAVTGSINAAKWTQGFLVALGFLSLLRGLLLAGVTRCFAVVAAATAALSPVTVAQFGSFYVDGMLGSALLVSGGAVVAWALTRSGLDLFAFAAGLIVAVNLKFTGLVYAALFVLLALILAGRRWPSRGEWYAVAAAVVAGCIATLQPYLHNLGVHGSLIHPLGSIDIIGTQMSAAFLDQPRGVKLWRALFNAPHIDAGEWGLGHEARLLLPRLWHYHVATQYVDARLGGFGTIFGYSLAASGLALIPGLLAARRWVFSGAGAAVVGLVTWVIVATIVHPELWWARYVPQLWWLPILVAAVAWICGLALRRLDDPCVGQPRVIAGGRVLDIANRRGTGGDRAFPWACPGAWRGCAA